MLGAGGAHLPTWTDLSALTGVTFGHRLSENFEPSSSEATSRRWALKCLDYPPQLTRLVVCRLPSSGQKLIVLIIRAAPAKN